MIILDCMMRSLNELLPGKLLGRVPGFSLACCGWCIMPGRYPWRLVLQTRAHGSLAFRAGDDEVGAFGVRVRLVIAGMEGEKRIWRRGAVRVK